MNDNGNHSSKQLIHLLTLTSFAFHKIRSNIKIHFINKKMYLRVHNNDFDILLRSVHYLAELQIPKIHKNAKQWSIIYTTRVQVRCLNMHISSKRPKTCNSVWVPLTRFHLSYASVRVGNVCTTWGTEGASPTVGKNFLFWVFLSISSCFPSLMSPKINHDIYPR